MRSDREIRVEAMAYAYNKVYGVPYELAREYQEYVFKRSDLISSGDYIGAEKLDEEYRDVVNEFRRLMLKAKKKIKDHSKKFQREYYKKYNELTKYSKKYFEDRKRKGLCLRCGRPVDDVRFVRCSRCRRHVEDWSSLMKWVNDIGKTGEWVVKQVLRSLPNVVENYKLPNNKRIEFYWKYEDVGIDVTVTHSLYASHFYWSQLRKKVEKYAEYLSELHVVVIEDRFSREDYAMLNDRVPMNTFVYNFMDIVNMLPVDRELFRSMICGFRFINECSTDEVRVVKK